MKNAKKLIVTILALAMVMTLCVSALADDPKGSITINNAELNKTYKLYKAFDLTTSGTGDNKVFIYTTDDKELATLITLYDEKYSAGGDCPFKIVSIDNTVPAKPVYTIQHKLDKNGMANTNAVGFGRGWLADHMFKDTVAFVVYTPADPDTDDLTTPLTEGEKIQDRFKKGTYSITLKVLEGTDEETGDPIYGTETLIAQGWTYDQYSNYIDNIHVISDNSDTMEVDTDENTKWTFTLAGWYEDNVDPYKSIKCTSTDATVKFENIPYGYYVMTPPDGTIINVNNIDNDISVNDKNPHTPGSPTKTVAPKTAVIGETVEYTSTLLGRKYQTNSGSSVNPVLDYTLTDTYSDGLDFDSITSVKLYYATDADGKDAMVDGVVTGTPFRTIEPATKYTAPTVVAEAEKPADYETQPESDAAKAYDAYQTYLDALKAYNNNIKKAYTLTKNPDTTDNSGGSFTLKFNVAEVQTVRNDKGEVQYVDPTATTKVPLTETTFYNPDASSYYIVITYKMTVDKGVYTKTPVDVTENEAAFAYNTFNGTFNSTQDPTPSNNPVNEKPKAYTYITEISMRKVNGSDTPLSGAKFVLARIAEGGGYEFYKIDTGTMPSDATTVYDGDGDYKVTWVTGKLDDLKDKRTDNDFCTIVTADNNFATAEFIGLKEGTYYIYEVEAPSGYTAPTTPWTVTITASDKFNADGTIGTAKTTVATTALVAAHSTSESNINIAGNQYGFYTATITNGVAPGLPETGGAGTTLLITIGSVLFLATAVVLVTKKRMYNAG